MAGGSLSASRKTHDRPRSDDAAGRIVSPVEEQFYVTLLDQIADGVYFVDTDRVITYWNGGAERITGYAAADVVGHSCSEGILRHVNDSGKQLCLQGCPLQGVMLDGKQRTANVYLHHKNGHRVPVRVQGHALRDDNGVITGSVEVFSRRHINQYDIAEQDGIADGLDPVTGLPPRRIGEKQLSVLLPYDADSAADGDGSAVEAQRGVGILFLDVDHFKAVNDNYGHRVGDDVLRVVGQSLANGLSSGDLPVRWGGEEFLAVLPAADMASVAATAERVRMLVEHSWLDFGDQTVRVTASVGATLSRPGEDVSAVVDRADHLMYRSKHSGRNRVTTDDGVLTSEAESPIIGKGIPWLMPEYMNR